MAADAHRVSDVNNAHAWTAAEAGDAIAQGSSPVALAKAILRHIKKFDPLLNVFVHLDEDVVLEAARIAEAELKRGNRRGPLHGVPVAIKDIIDVAGMPTTCHSALLLDEVATEDAHVVKLLRGAGAIILGKVATHEFAMGGPSFDLPFPPARNPWSRDHNPGGSSSGSGAGVAAELFPLALGTDTLGSVRHPAAACGIVGLKPTYGLVSRGGVFPLAQTLDHVGPMARTVKDAALLLDVIAGYDPLDPGSSEKRGSISYTRNLDDDIRSFRIGFIRHFHESDMICDPEVGDALENAAKVLAAEGASVESVTLPPLSDFASAAGVIIHSEAWSVHAKWMRERPQSYGQLSRKRFLTGAFFPAEALVAAQRVRLRMISMVEEALSQFDVLLCANLMDPPPRIDDEADLAYKHPRQARAPFNLTGHPAISMMSGLSQSGLPLSLQFVGRYFDEARLLGVAAAFERTTSWHTLRPPLIS